MATSTVLEITVRGRSAHGARPHEGVDAIYAASQIVLSLQAIISRETNAVDAKVVTIGEISGGTSPNVIAGQVLLRGTMRAFSNETMEGLEALVIERCCKVAEAFGASADVTLLRLYPPLVNHTEITNMIREAGMLCPWIREIREIPTPGMGGDDFAFYTQQIPGAMFRLGSALSNRKTKLHTPTFDFDESVLTFGTALLAVIAVKMLALDTRI
jgi:amidohydrolase